MSTKARVFQNNKEKVLSTDMNARQNLLDKAAAQVFARQLIDPRRSGMLYPGVAIQDATLPIYKASVVVGGLMVQPSTSSITIQPGLVAMLCPSLQGADDSPVVVVDDVGMQTGGVLNYTANGGSIRWDLVECQPYLEQLQESRNIWDKTAKVYVPTLVYKRCTVRLNYRIRTGTGGAGLPTLDPDWLPLAAIHVPANAASFDVCDFYDVRPLLEDRVQPAMYNGAGTAAAVAANLFKHLGGDWIIMDDPVTTDRVMAGHAEAVFGGYLAGGELRQSMPSAAADFGATKADQDHLSLDRADNKQAALSYRNGSTSTTSTYWVAALFPALLPRWVRYSQSSIPNIGRVPRGPRGILMVMDYNGMQAIYNNGFVDTTTIPAVLGLTTSCMGVVLTSFMCDGSGVPQGNCRNNRVTGQHAGFVSSTQIAETSPGSGVFEITLRPNLDIPPGVSEIWLELQFQGTGTAGATMIVTTDQSYEVVIVPSLLDTFDWAKFTVRIPMPALPSAVAVGSTSDTVVVTVDTNGWGTVFSYAIVRSWRQGP
jgi:hypothetical protein